MTLPMILLMLLMFTFCLAQDNEVPMPAGHAADYVIDTVTLFDPNTYEERVVIYKMPASMSRQDGIPASAGLKNDQKAYTLDTVIVYDPVTRKEKLTKITVVTKKE